MVQVFHIYGNICLLLRVTLLFTVTDLRLKGDSIINWGEKNDQKRNRSGN